MFLTRTEYDRAVNTFSPEGRLFQVEYAEAIRLGSTAIRIKTEEGVVLAVEKRIGITSPLLVLTLKESKTIALTILKQVMEEKVTPNNINIAKVAPNYHISNRHLKSKLLLAVYNVPS